MADRHFQRATKLSAAKTGFRVSFKECVVVLTLPVITVPTLWRVLGDLRFTRKISQKCHNVKLTVLDFPWSTRQYDLSGRLAAVRASLRVVRTAACLPMPA